MPPKRIKADGSKSARIALIGEAGGKHEARLGRPFVGPSGKLLDQWWSQVGLSRKDFWIDNVYPFQPPKNELKMVHPDDLKAWTADLHDRLAELPNLNLIVPTGETALRALTRMKGISKYRGSILSYSSNLDRGRQIKVVPTFHPAYTFRRPIEAKTCMADWRRIAEDSKFPELRLPVREYYTKPKLEDFQWFTDQWKGKDTLAIDAEWTQDQLLCVGFSVDPTFSFTIPTTLDYWGSEIMLKKAIGWIQTYCESEIGKVLQHGHSDAFILRHFHNIYINNYKWDTLAMHHALDPNSEHSLEYMASIYTRQPYWKDEAKEPEKIAKYASNFDALLTYNGIDVCVTRELFDVFYPMLIERNLMDFYHHHYQEMFEPMIELMLHGIQVDQQKRKERQAKLQMEVIKLQDQISLGIGEQAFAEKSLKGPVLMNYFYNQLKLSKVMRTRKRKGGEKVRTPSIDEVAIRRLMLKHEKARPIGELVLDHRRKHQLMSFYG